MFVKPAPGLMIKCPILLDVLPPEGREVEASDYWQRALRDGDVTTMASGAQMVDPPGVMLPPPGDEPSTLGHTEESAA